MDKYVQLLSIKAAVAIDIQDFGWAYVFFVGEGDKYLVVEGLGHMVGICLSF